MEWASEIPNSAEVVNAVAQVCEECAKCTDMSDVFIKALGTFTTVAVVYILFKS